MLTTVPGTTGRYRGNRSTEWRWSIQSSKIELHSIREARFAVCSVLLRSQRVCVLLIGENDVRMLYDICTVLYSEYYVKSEYSSTFASVLPLYHYKVQVLVLGVDFMRMVVQYNVL
jgi:hypothetical protein